MRRTYSRSGRLIRQISPRHRVLLGVEEHVFKRSTQRIQCASAFVAETLIREHGVARDRIFLLPNAVDATRFGTPAALAAGRRLRAELDDRAEKIWLFPASGWHRKGLSTLLQAFATIPDPGSRLWIAGRDDPARWRKMATDLGIASRVRFLGERRDLENVYGAVDGMILPTHYDAFANVTLEAAASQLPIITTRFNGAAEWLDEKIITLEDSRDSLALAAAIRDLSSQERRRKLGAGAQKIAGRLDWAKHVAALNEEYARIVRRRNPKHSCNKQAHDQPPEQPPEQRQEP